MNDLGYFKAKGIYYRTELKSIEKKKNVPQQAIFEAFTNGLEAIKEKKKRYSTNERGELELNIYFINNLWEGQEEEVDKEFLKIEIIDSGIGLEDVEFKRLETLKDDRKSFLNKGTGRVQFIHTFNETKITSIYKNPKSKTKFSKRVLTLSKKEQFLKENAIIRLDSCEEVQAEDSKTILMFDTVLKDKDKKYYDNLNVDELKKDLIRHYLVYFCENRNSLPDIKICSILNGKLEYTSKITSNDIPIPHKDKEIKVNYSIVKNNKVELVANKEAFILKSFKIQHKELKQNELRLVCKGEIAKAINLNCILPQDIIADNRYLFLLSGEYINNRDSDTRGDIKIIKKSDFKERNKDGMISEEEVLLESIEDKANQFIISVHKEIDKKNKEKVKSIEELQQMFLIDPAIIGSLRDKIKLSDSDADILRKIYNAETKSIAENDAKIKYQLKELKSLIPNKNEYQNNLDEKINEFVKSIPLQNRTALTHYVARRKLVLELFEMVLKKELEKLNNNGRIDEDMLHNLIFQQSSNNPEDSDLWLVNEEFIYFKGASESKLNKIKMDGKEVFNKLFSEEEKRYLNSLGEKRLTKRPDVLLFPEEGKCIIVEFKAPDVNVSEYLTQIDFYANLIRNYTNEEFQITTFYGYLIGESIEDRDVRGRVSRFEHSYHFDYWFRPAENVIGFDGRSNGSIYTEVLKYSTLLERAQLRNKIFIDKLDGRK